MDWQEVEREMNYLLSSPAADQRDRDSGGLMYSKLCANFAEVPTN